MHKDALIYMDAENRGRFFCTGMRWMESFYSLHALDAFLRIAASKDDCAAVDPCSFIYPKKAALAAIRLSIVAVDEAGVHGLMQLPQTERVAFKSSDALLERIRKETKAASLKRRKK